MHTDYGANYDYQAKAPDEWEGKETKRMYAGLILSCIAFAGAAAGFVICLLASLASSAHPLLGILICAASLALAFVGFILGGISIPTAKAGASKAVFGVSFALLTLAMGSFCFAVIGPLSDLLSNLF